MFSKLSRILCLGFLVADSARAAEFDREIAPLLVKRCLECHNDRDAAGGLRLTTAEHARRGGESGAAFEPGDPAESLLLERLATGEMPPPRKGVSQKLPDAEIAVLRKWIAGGAAWPDNRVLDLYEASSDVRGGRDWWSLQSVRRPTVPQTKRTAFVFNPIDNFIQARLEREQMQPAPLASKPQLLRRLYVDLVGLPPSFEQIQAFVQDKRPDAYRRVVDQLLDSPHFGERWARHWLDLVRFAETSGYERDQVKPFAWKYRDWVVRAFNEDMPYDQFVIHQLAGDELPDRDAQSVIATGFLRLGTWNDEPNDPEDYQYDRLEDLVHSTSSAFLGLTVKCARCHDHKFDPIPQVDYYRVAAAFWAGPVRARDRKLLGGSSAEELGVPDVLGWTDLRREPPPIRLLKSGERHQPRDVVQPASLSFAPSLFREFSAPPANSKTSQRRLQLAQWIAQPDHPLTARVMVNRLWQHHFGAGIVRSPNNFGFRGDQPTHPQLLDWLAAEFVAGGWKMKRIHRLIVMSRAYQQSSSEHPQFDQYDNRDHLNQLYWRSNRRRLDAESLRDAMLVASGELDRRLGGPSFRPTITRAALEGLSRKSSAWQPSSEAEQRRRSLYIFSKRGLLPPMMTTFDFADTTLPCAQRDVTIVAPQALELLNSQFSHQRANAMADRILQEEEDPAAQVQAAWRWAYGRRASDAELQIALPHLEQQRTRFRAQSTGEPATGKPVIRQTLPDLPDLVLHLSASREVHLDENGRVKAWGAETDPHRAHQRTTQHRPELIKDGFGEHPVVRFDGRRRFFHVKGALLSGQSCSIFAVANDRGKPGHREIISNWSSTNSTTSQFLGLTADNVVRFSDAFNPAGRVVDRGQPFLISAFNGPGEAAVYQSRSLLARRGDALPTRRLETPWVIGQQGSIDGEYWQGDIAELLVYDRLLTAAERSQVWSYLLPKYKLKLQVDAPPSAPPRTAEQLALAALCQVLMNSNEFLFVD